jgi:guanine deaminase
MTLRGTICWPLSPNEAVFLDDGVVAADLGAPRQATRDDPPPVDGVIVPAFADWHFHWVQLGIAGRGGETLLAWLERTTWPEEKRFADAQVCRDEAPLAALALRRAGTLAGAAYGSPQPESATAFLDAAPASFLCGPAVMTSGGPPALRRDLVETVRDIERLADRFGSRAVVAPRFALSCDETTLAALGDIARRRGLPVETHLAETGDEVEAVRRAFPSARDYTDVYARSGLLGPRTLLGHAIHVSDDELRTIAASGAVVVHCPTSNLALGSGRMEVERLRAHGVPWTLGSDVGAGPELSMFDAIAAGLSVHDGFARVTATELFHRATLGGDVVLGGRTERPQARCGDRPGALVLPRPGGAGSRDRDPETWLRALVAAWEDGTAPEPMRVVAWTDPAQPGPA